MSKWHSRSGSSIKPDNFSASACNILLLYYCFQLVPYRPTDDEVVYSKRLGNKVLVDLNRSNPLTVI